MLTSINSDILWYKFIKLKDFSFVNLLSILPLKKFWSASKAAFVFLLFLKFLNSSALMVLLDFIKILLNSFLHSIHQGESLNKVFFF